MKLCTCRQLSKTWSNLLKILYAKVCYIVSAVYIKMLGWASFVVALHSMAAPLVGDLPEDFEALYMSIIIKNLVKFIENTVC